ncbi:apolipoprotein D-like isoform X2 [Panulirus ornatus]|uniref:apolipoprotein D-like isoform X2 n=1 Tax=Panulirus ornatus TaxID=150431 RepID=UPI003A89DB18
MCGLNRKEDSYLDQECNLTATEVLAPYAAVTNPPETQYLGKWYEIEKYFAIFEIGGRCITATYSDKGSGKIGVVNEQIGVIGDKPNSIEAEAQFVDPDSGEAKLFVSFGIDFR